MDVKDFVSSSLQQIIEAVEETQRSLQEKKSTAEINPNDTEGIKRNLHPVEFDMSVTVTDEGEMKAGGKLKIMSLGVDGAASKMNQNELVHQLKFTIPVAMPISAISADHADKARKSKKLQNEKIQRHNRDSIAKSKRRPDSFG